MYAYTGFRLIRFLCRGKIKWLAWGLLLSFWFIVILHIYLRVTFIYPGLSNILAWIGYSGLGFITYLFCLVFLRDVSIILSLSFIKTIGRFSSQKKRPFNSERRRFLFTSTGYAIAAVSGAGALYGAVEALQPPRVVHLDIVIHARHSRLKGLKLVQFTDLHVGPTIGYGYVKKVSEIIHSLHADIIVFTGDLADGAPVELGFDVSPLLDISAPLGKYFVTGNHEYYSGADRWIGHAAELGFRPLLNENVVLDYNGGILTLSGVTDIRAGNFSPRHKSDPQKAFRGCPKNSFKLLCAHQPTSIYEASNMGVDLQLSGHTHGGQYFPFNFFVRMGHPFVKGLYRYKNALVYVSQGTGYWGPPLRTGTFPEITQINFI